MNIRSERNSQWFERAWYSASIGDFVLSDPAAILGELARNSDFSVDLNQRNAWLAEVEALKSGLGGLEGHLFLEFNIPRMGRRIDAVVLTGAAVFVLEFKVGEDSPQRDAVEQVWDYALDLKNFHEASHDLPVIPVLVLTEGNTVRTSNVQIDPDGVYRPISIHAKQLHELIENLTSTLAGDRVDSDRWYAAVYKPTPTIIEAARALYQHHSVAAIARSDAAAQNLSVTSGRIQDLIDEAKASRRKVICFVTGVPGAGKTLVGLNAATQRTDGDSSTHAVFLSGNGPLVKVLREALTRDYVSRLRLEKKKVRKSLAGESIKAFIQNVHHFRDDALQNPAPPIEHIAIFDEAQRAWNVRQTANFMLRKKGRSGFSQSEPEFLISCMDRHPDWAVVVCLVGGGQEINTGEAGIDAWLDAITANFPNWSVYISPRLNDSEYSAGRAVDRIRERQDVHFDESLHLAVSMRSFRAENVSMFVKALLDCEEKSAREVFSLLVDRYPV
ncbi:MAG TPA: DNA/RNA helicase domain-containing protein, partial [Candidatus Krumholzibacteria bacterium]|nr:DNA/RNA helicase domain-containing protein [Candidatus Krumholzibacteria bacterium]